MKKFGWTVILLFSPHGRHTVVLQFEAGLIQLCSVLMNLQSECKKRAKADKNDSFFCCCLGGWKATLVNLSARHSKSFEALEAGNTRLCQLQSNLVGKTRIGKCHCDTCTHV